MTAHEKLLFTLGCLVWLQETHQIICHYLTGQCFATPLCFDLYLVPLQAYTDRTAEWGALELSRL